MTYRGSAARSCHVPGSAHRVPRVVRKPGEALGEYFVRTFAAWSQSADAHARVPSLGARVRPLPGVAPRLEVTMHNGVRWVVLRRRT